MILAVDLTNFRDMTGGDKELELALFEHFYAAGDESIAALTESCASGNDKTWLEAVHAFKGIALNLGANTLADACKVAQDNFDAALEHKRAMLAEITAAFDAAKAQLQQESGPIR